MKQDKSCSIKTSIGGQALIEGIMMRGPWKTAMAVRNSKGEMVLEDWNTKGVKRKKFFRLPFIRGMFNFIDSMVIGYKCLMKSAMISGLADIQDEEKIAKEKKKAKKAAKKEEKRLAKKGIVLEKFNSSDCCTNNDNEVKETIDSQEIIDNQETIEYSEATSVDNNIETECSLGKDEILDKKDKKSKKKDKEEKDMVGVIAAVSTVFSIVLVLGLFIWLPTFLYMQLGKIIPAMNPENRYLKSIFEGVLKVAMLVIYMSIVSRMKDIHRVFMYHGAEHKTIFCYENGLELTVENVRIQRRFHPRCGTSFIVFMVLIGILISFFIPPTLSTGIRTLIKFALLPIIMGIGYELIKFAGKHDGFITKIISAPGLWLQHITTAEPDDSMIECAIAAMKKVIPDDGSDIIE